MSEEITIATATATIYGTHADALAYITLMFGPAYTAWVDELEADDQKKTLIAATRRLEQEAWSDDYPDFEDRDALEAFQHACYELAVLVYEDPSVIGVADQGNNIRTAYASGAGVEYFNPTTKNAPLLPPVLMRLVGGYLGTSSSGGPVGGGGQAGSCVNPFSSCSDLDRDEPY